MQTLATKRSWKSRLKYALTAGLFAASYAISMVAPFVQPQIASAAETCVVDTAGANDEPGQKDLNKMCQDTASATSISVSWQWDEIKWTGNNTGDACSLFDTDGDSKANYSVCVTIGGNAVQQANSPRIYTCGDDAAERCSQPIGLVAGPYAPATTCSVSVQSVDPFPTGSEYNKDAVATCTISLSHVGGADTANLIDVCSYPSQQPNSDPSDCVVYVTRSAKIEVIKDIVSDNPTGLFNLVVDGPGADDTTTASNRGDNGTTGPVTVVLPQGNNLSASVSETAGTDTDLANYASSISCVNRGTTTVVASTPSGTSLAVPVSDDADIVCTITNRQNGSITIIKQADPESDQQFSFNATGTGVSNFFLVDDGTTANTKTFSNLTPGTYGFSETPNTGWDLDLNNTTCSDGSPVNEVQLSAGENVTCTFTNLKQGKLVVQKTTLPAGETQSFAVTASTANGEVIGSVNGNVTDASDYTYTVKPGTYSVAETVPVGWEKTGDTCQDVVVAPGETKYCTITNTKLSTITIKKNALPNALQDFNFTATGDRVSGFMLDDDSSVTGADNTYSNQKVFEGLLPGTYTFAESTTSGWDFDGFETCSGAGVTTSTVNRSVTIELVAGQSVSCTFKNRMHGQLIVRKATFPAGSNQLFSVTASSSNDGQIFGGSTKNVSDTTDAVFGIQQNKTYSVTETVPAGWAETSNNCQNLTVGASAGELVNGVPTVYCDIVNTKLAGLNITKQTDPDGDKSMFDFTDNTGQGTGSFQLGDGQTKSFTDLAPSVAKTVTETGEDGWRLTSIVCDEDSAVENIITQSVTYTPTPGQSANCTFTNTKLGSIYGVKWNDLNGNGFYSIGEEPTLDGWTIQLTGTNMLGEVVNQSYVTGTAAPNTGSYSFNDLLPGTYTVSEVWQSGWEQTSTPEDHSVNLVAGTPQGPLNFGNQAQGTIRVLKTVDNGYGEKTASTAWTWDYTGDNLYFPNPSGSNVATGAAAITVGADTYTISEDQKANYHFTSVACTNDGQNFAVTQAETFKVTVGAGDDIVCTFLNTRDTGTLEVKKVLSPNTDPGKFNLQIDGVTTGTGANVGNNGTTGTQKLTTGEYSVGETAGTNTNLANYSASYVCLDGDRQVASGNGTSLANLEVGKDQHIICTFTNTRKTTEVIVVKDVVNDHGGTKTYADFHFQVNGGVEQTFLAKTSPDGARTITVNVGDGFDITEPEANTMGYKTSYHNCTESTAAAGITYTCTITNNDIPPKLTVYKHVENGFTNLEKQAKDFTMNVVGTDVSDANFPGDESGTTVTLDAGNYAVGEGNHEGYTMTTEGDCEDTIAIGEEKTCHVYNRAIEDARINIVKDGPDQAHEGDTVTYTFVVTNPGNVPLSYVDVLDDIAGEATYVMGDTDNDQKLDPGETWHFTVDYVIPQDQDEDVLNTATVCGEYGNRTESEDTGRTLEKEVCDDDSHTLDVLHPSLVVEKTGPANLLLGNTATYTFTIKNTGDTPLDLTQVLDDLAGEATYVSGDANENDLLDLTETWEFTATYKPTAVGNVVNTVEVCGMDELEKEVCDTDDHTTFVYVPEVLGETTPPVLQDTGTPVTIAWIISGALLGLAILTQLNIQRTQKWLAAMRAGLAQPFSVI